MLSAARLGENAILLHFLVEAPKGTLEGLVLADDHFGHKSPSPLQLL